MKAGTTLDKLSAELERQLATKLDLKCPTSWMQYHAVSSDDRLAIALPTGEVDYGTTELARRQLADKLKIPYTYFSRMQEKQRRLLEDNVNTWLKAGDDERLVRILDGRVRAILSERYRRLDNYEVAESILPILLKLPGARFVSCELTDAKMYLKVVATETSFEIAKGDVIQAGVIVSNSEVGCGSLTVQPLVYRTGKTTGFIMPDSKLMKRHVGRILEAEDEGLTVFKDDTLKADDMAFFKKVRDVVDYCVSQSMLAVVGEKMRRTLGIAIVGNVIKVVEVLAQKYDITDGERDGILKRLATGGDLSALGLVNAVSAFSADVSDYDRATELEEVSGRLLSMPAKELVDLASVE